MELETIKEYDQIISTIVQNVMAEMKRTNNKIVLWDFQREVPSDRLYYHVACIVSDICNKQIYLQMPFIEYLKFKRQNKTRKNLHWIRRNCKWLADENKTSVYILMDFVREFYNIDISLFEKINEEYYEGDK